MTQTAPAETPASKAAHSGKFAKKLPKVASSQVKSFAKAMFQHHRANSKFHKDIEKSSTKAQTLVSDSTEKNKEGIRKVLSADPFRWKQSKVQMFSADPFKNPESDQSAVCLTSSNESNSSKSSNKEANTSKVENASELKGAIDGDFEKRDSLEPENRPVPEPYSEPDAIYSQKAPLPNSPISTEMPQKAISDSFVNTEADFLDSVNATLSYGQVDYAASGMPFVNFAAVIYGEQGFEVAAPAHIQMNTQFAGENTLSAVHSPPKEEHVHTRARAPSDSSYSSSNSAARTRLFSFSHEDNDSDRYSLTDTSDDENTYISVKFPSARIFKRRPVSHNTCRVHDYTPDLYSVPSPQILQPSAESVTKSGNLSEAEKLDNLISEIEGIVREKKVLKNDENFSNYEVSAVDQIASVDPLNIASFQDRKKSDFSKSEIEILAEECRHQLYTSNSWLFAEELLDKVEEMTGYNGISSEFSNHDNSLSDESEMKSFAEFSETFRKRVSQNDKNFSTSLEEADTLINVVYGYRQIFLHLVRNVVLPNGETLRNLLKEILYLRSKEGDLVSEAVRINREIDESCKKHGFDSTMHQNLADRISSLKSVETRFQRCESDQLRLEKAFTFEISPILRSISKIISVRTRLLQLWTVFYTSSNLAEQFKDFDLVTLTHKGEYEKMTMWYSEVDVNQLEEHLNQSMQSLASCGALVQNMMESLQ